MYGSETWRMNAGPIKKIQSFINTCLRRIIKIHWPERISNNELWKRTSQRPVQDDITERKWRWIGHTLRKKESSITRQALTWNPQGSRNRGRPSNTWRRDVEREARAMGLTWGEVARLAQDRNAFRNAVSGLCPPLDAQYAGNF